MGIGERRVRAAIVGAALAVVLAAVAMPAAADARPRWIYVNASPYWCLDSNHAGDVYLNPCQTGNRYQLWESWEGGWTRNVATGRCLQADGYGHPALIHAARCAYVVQQYWRAWWGGWKQRQQWNPSFPGGRAVCLARQGENPGQHEVTGVECRNPTGDHPDSQEWLWTLR